MSPDPNSRLASRQTNREAWEGSAAGAWDRHREAETASPAWGAALAASRARPGGGPDALGSDFLDLISGGNVGAN